MYVDDPYQKPSLVVEIYTRFLYESDITNRLTPKIQIKITGFQPEPDFAKTNPYFNIIIEKYFTIMSLMSLLSALYKNEHAYTHQFSNAYFYSIRKYSSYFNEVL